MHNASLNILRGDRFHNLKANLSHFHHFRERFIANFGGYQKKKKKDDESFCKTELDSNEMSFYSDLQMIQKPTPRKKVFQNALSEGITGIQVFLPWVTTSKTSINPSAPSTAVPLFPKSHSRFFGRNSAKITQRRWTFSFKCLVMCILKLPLSEINHGLTCKPLHTV